GMDEATKERIFEPFFTTKKIGEGTGLGLSIVYGVMAAHKGFVRCQSQPGAGTTFSLYFPKLQAAMEDAEVQGPLGNLSGAETILLVDDEDEVVSLASEAFAGYGYTLYTARTGEEALRLYQEQGDKIDLVVLDLVMPGMGGRQCLKELRTMDPNVRVLVASGFATDETVKQLLKGGAMGFLKKPFEFEELLAQIRAILDGAAPRP
ncbi:MAG: response regulator, partial [Desulfomonilaceae bacterium]